jgi:hypothetical protein
LRAVSLLLIWYAGDPNGKSRYGRINATKVSPGSIMRSDVRIYFHRGCSVAQSHDVAGPKFRLGIPTSAGSACNNKKLEKAQLRWYETLRYNGTEGTNDARLTFKYELTGSHGRRKRSPKSAWLLLYLCCLSALSE